MPIDGALGEKISQFFTDKREAVLRYRELSSLPGEDWRRASAAFFADAPCGRARFANRKGRDRARPFAHSAIHEITSA